MVENGREWTLEDAHRARDLIARTAKRRAEDDAREKARLDAIRSEQRQQNAGAKSALIADIMARARQANRTVGR